MTESPRHAPVARPHRYPNPDGTSDCAYGCGCWMGPFNSGGPKGLDPFGSCPKAPAPPPPPDPLPAYEVAPCFAYPSAYEQAQPDTDERPLAPGAEPIYGAAYCRRDEVEALLSRLASSPTAAADARAALEALRGPGGEG